MHTPEFDALLGNDTAAMGELGLERIAMALISLCDGISPEDFTRLVRAFMSVAQHPTLGPWLDAAPQFAGSRTV